MKKRIAISVILFILFLCEIFAIKVIDVQPIGPNGTSIGLATLNAKIHSLTGESILWYNITDVFGLIAIIVCALFGLVGFVQLMQRKNIAKVDSEIIILGVFYVIVISLYVLFNKFAINYRPIIMPGETMPESSFPSSHTMLVITVFSSLIMIIDDYLKIPSLSVVIKILACIIIVVTIIGRLLSGVHWFTDIIGSLIISSSLLFLFRAAISKK